MSLLIWRTPPPVDCCWYCGLWVTFGNMQYLVRRCIKSDGMFCGVSRARNPLIRDTDFLTCRREPTWYVMSMVGKQGLCLCIKYGFLQASWKSCMDKLRYRRDRTIHSRMHSEQWLCAGRVAACWYMLLQVLGCCRCCSRFF
jgi:hypothetical protein